MLFRVGSRYENTADNGISHFLEHMLYRGSPSLKTAHEQALAFEELGASLYAATQADYGSMSLSLPPESLARATALRGGGLRTAILRHRDRARHRSRRDPGRPRRRGAPDRRRQLVQRARVRRAPTRLHHHRFCSTTLRGSIARCCAGTTLATTRPKTRCFASPARYVRRDAFVWRRSDSREACRAAGGVPAAPTTLDQQKTTALARSQRLSQTTLRIAFRAVSDRDPREPALEMLLRVLDDGMSTAALRAHLRRQGSLLRRGSALTSRTKTTVCSDVAAEVQHERVVDVAREICACWGNLLGRARPRPSWNGPRRATCGRRKHCSRRPRWHRCLLRPRPRSRGSSRRRVNDMSSSCK